MRCEENIQGLIDAAALGHVPEGNVGTHLQHCARCQSRFQHERQLFASIDDALHAQMSDLPRPGFLARARARLSNEPTTDTRVGATWAAVPVLVLALLASTHQWNKSQPSVMNATSTPVSVQQNLSSATFAGDTGKAREGARPRKSSRSISRIMNKNPHEPEVLVPPDEQIAFTQFVARVAGRDAMAEAVVRQAPNKTLPADATLPQVSSVDVAQLERVDNDSLAEADGSE